MRKADIPAIKEPTGLDRTDGKRPHGLTLVPRQSDGCLTWTSLSSIPSPRRTSATPHCWQGVLRKQQPLRNRQNTPSSPQATFSPQLPWKHWAPSATPPPSSCQGWVASLRSYQTSQQKQTTCSRESLCLSSATMTLPSVAHSKRPRPRVSRPDLLPFYLNLVFNSLANLQP